jgi:hypothetical protein
MPNHLEHVVRPSQAPQIRPGFPSQLFATQKIPENNAQTWGTAGNSVFDLKAHAQVELPAPKFENSRKFDTVKVKNPDDTTQSVTTEQMTEYTGSPKQGGQKITLKFTPPVNTDFTEVLTRNNIRQSGAGV